MGYIKEPAGVDFVVSPMPFSVEDRQAVSAIIARYKITGEIPKPSYKVKARKGGKPASATKPKHSHAKKATPPKKVSTISKPTTR